MNTPADHTTNPTPPTLCDPDGFEYLRTAIRAHLTRDAITSDTDPAEPKRPRALAQMRTLPQRTLVFDCETTTDATQRLLFGVWRIYVDGQDAEPGSFCVEEGIFFADELPTIDPDAHRLLCDIARTEPADVAPGCSTRLRLLSRTSFLNDVFYKWAYQLHGTVVGFNLPFDLSRLAVHAAPARKRNRGGISLQLWSHNGGEHPYRPRIAIKTIDARRSLISFTNTADATQHYRGRFLDLATLTFAHDSRHHSLESACERFGVPYSKRAVTYGKVTADYVAYCREDVDATARLYRATQVEHLRHPIALPAHHAFSAATVGKAYWTAMGITPWAERETPPDPTISGYGMAAFYGGRAECRIRKADVPVVYVDFLAMYMTCNALMGTWRHITANHTAIVDATTDVRDLLAADDLRDRCFGRGLWRQLHTLVEVDPNGAILPVRARYDRRTWNVGINPHRNPNTCWYPLADIIAAKLLGGPAPIVKRALRLVPSDDQLATLRNVHLGGQVEINPKHHDFFATVIEQRQRIRHDTDLPAAERDRLAAFLKVLANATGYGILAQYDRHDEHERIPVTIHTAHQPFTLQLNKVEDPGSFTNPALAATVTGAARLMLALLEHEVTRHGGTYAFCDTDSMAIVATNTGDTLTIGNDQIRAIDWNTVQTIVDSFAALNPYNPAAVPGSILEIERENFTANRRQRELRCYAISAKRYQLTTRDGTNAKASAHGLGHLLNPVTRTTDEHWITDAWHWLRHPDDEPDWLDLPALSRITITSADTLRWFQPLNHGLEYRDRIKPYNFLLIAHTDPLEPGDEQPITPYRTDLTNWRTWQWIDRHTGNPVHVHTQRRDGHQRPGARLLTYRDILHRYHQHPEHKSLNPSGQPCTGTTRGLLRRRPVHAIDNRTYIGKEAHDLDNRAVGLTDPDDTLGYNTTDDVIWTPAVIATLRTIPARDIADLTGVNLRTVQRARAGTHTPRLGDRAVLRLCAIKHARAHVDARRIDDDDCVLYRYITTRDAHDA